MDYEKKYKDVQKWVESIYTKLNHKHQMKAEALFPALRKSKGERIRETLIEYIKNWQEGYSRWNSDKDFCKDAIAWLEKRANNPYSGVSFDYEGHTWGMCARDGGVDILLDSKLITHIEKQDNQIEEMERKFPLN